ncbi:uncharacterized protein RAG0_14730 [Rhynchosporium agropyri]|uniref:Zn(2)-C6 fungal-type domain-containing protein n=1 Tax=Rhynchosporium agropyri TaxID=914238 RepID=A0A1E1LID6_9HELO|nr:uncharacterized protein RAG0_14730 [Rhynchosporium agropyri]
MPKLLTTKERTNRDANLRHDPMLKPKSKVAASNDQPPFPSSSSSSSPSAKQNSPTKKLDATEAGLVKFEKDDNPTNVGGRQIKRRAAQACDGCRARKVRCDVLKRWKEKGATCTNCEHDGAICTVRESARCKYKGDHIRDIQVHNRDGGDESDSSSQSTPKWTMPNAFSNAIIPKDLESGWASVLGKLDHDKPHESHLLYQTAAQRIAHVPVGPPPSPQHDPKYNLPTSASMIGDSRQIIVADGHLDRAATLPFDRFMGPLPVYLNRFPARMIPVNIQYLYAKGALAIPEDPFRNALLQAYCEWVYPYMPCLELHFVLAAINDPTGSSGTISLLLFQAIMFAGIAFVEKEYLVQAGYSTRKAARKAFFQKAKIIYDLNYETDHVSVVQSLLLMTYWYVAPNDQKDTWHLMGNAVRLGYTIGLHRNHAKSNMDPAKMKLWKRIWWCCFMRDHLVALGMRRPTQIEEASFDVPILEEEDFEIGVLASNNTIISPDCTLMRETHIQRDLAQMCIAKAKLCLCISHIFTAQYSTLDKHLGMQRKGGTTQSALLLVPKRSFPGEVSKYDRELKRWLDDRPPACLDSNGFTQGNAGRTIFIQRALLHLLYHTAVSALHRPQFSPCTAASNHEIQEASRRKVYIASKGTTAIAQTIRLHQLERYLPSTAVTVLTPAIVTHMQYLISQDDETEETAADGFHSCMAVLQCLRETYVTADDAMMFLMNALSRVGGTRDLTASNGAESNPSNPWKLLPNGKGIGKGNLESMVKSVERMKEWMKERQLHSPEEEEMKTSTKEMEKMDDDRTDFLALFLDSTAFY